MSPSSSRRGPVRKYTYRELISTVATVAHAFTRQGIAKGDRVALLSENRPEWVFAYLAATSLGAVIVPMDAQLTDKEIAVLLANCAARAVCVSAATREKLPAVRQSCRLLRCRRRRAVPRHDEGEPCGGPSAAPADSDLAAILYTSGTTGDPKA